MSFLYFTLLQGFSRVGSNPVICLMKIPSSMRFSKLLLTEFLSGMEIKLTFHTGLSAEKATCS